MSLSQYHTSGGKLQLRLKPTRKNEGTAFDGLEKREPNNGETRNQIETKEALRKTQQKSKRKHQICTLTNYNKSNISLKREYQFVIKRLR